MDQSDNILDNLTTINGKEDSFPKKVTKKQTVQPNPAVKKVVQPKPAPQYTYEGLSNLGTNALTALCLKLGVATAKRKAQMIENILNK